MPKIASFTKLTRPNLWLKSGETLKRTYIKKSIKVNIIIAINSNQYLQLFPLQMPVNEKQNIGNEKAGT